MISGPGSINLASQPFRRERAQNALYAAACAALAVSLLVFVSLILHTRAQAAGIRQQIGQQQKRLQSLQREQSEFQGILGRPGNADVFSTTVFLNELIARRAVSWTRAFEDLHTVIPGNIRLEAIRMPQVGAPDPSGVTRVQLDMSVGTETPTAVIELLKKLQSSALFGPAEVVSQSPPTQNDPLYKYRVRVAYGQKL